ncbi:probable protein phosphatase 2C 79 [Zingiber officinale]|uniref:probable protein phosphatase 2C 79 n=1 Tax=Zingiber officinale TaxID=94328 RepID=UPI001C4D8B42|nr:probable protein phosphatase 2C 79 [Zingiber officinale]
MTVASLVEVDIGGELLTKSSNLSDDGLLLILSKGEKLHSWIDYDEESKRIEVRLCQDKDPKEASPSISHSIDLSYMLWREASWVGLSSWSGNSSHGSSIYSWNFTEKRFVTEQESMSIDVIRKAYQVTEEGFISLVTKQWPVKPQIAAVGSCCLVGVICGGFGSSGN